MPDARQQTISDYYRIIEITSTISTTVLSQLIATAGGDLTVPNPVENNKFLNISVLEVRLTPSADILVADLINGDTITVLANTTKIIPVVNAHMQITLLNAAMVAVELFLQD